MYNYHKERMRVIGSLAIPPKGTQAREWLEQILKEETPERKKILKNLWEKAQATVIGQQLNGAGHETDQALRCFQAEYNNRTWSHDLHSLPTTFNVIEAFLHYNPELNAFILHQERNHLFSFTDFLNWYTSEDINFDPTKALETLSPGVIYSFDTLYDPADLLYRLDCGSEAGIAGFAMVRFNTEVSVLCVAGETENLGNKTEELKKSVPDRQVASSRQNITPDPSLSVQAVPLKSKQQLWRLIALTRFDLNDMSQSVRYVCHDAGDSFLITTDDANVFLNMKGEFIDKNLEEFARNSVQKLNGYNALFDLCSTSLFLPLYFEYFDDDIAIERFKTDYANEVGKVSFQKIKKFIPPDLKLAYRNVNVLKSQENCSDIKTTIYSIPNFHIETSGYWRNLELGKIGTDKNGNSIHGRTWVSKKLTWMEAEDPSALIAKREQKKMPSEGPSPGYIYVMRSPLHAKNVFKVGLTKRTTAERADELSASTAVPGKIYVMHEWLVDDCVFIEQEIHNQLSEFRVDPRREFFEAPLKNIVSVIEKTIQEYDTKKSGK